ncbi:hypothetical protein GRS48_03325 [Halorubrum sp. JWXQ-INN 858]|uniref:hypothetical protein n=1 Tax=Halorubrum sp. JWXQ-INN 858 TaxID=2690782 RepID=UPI0013569ECA|nr:hypothetical protein [Halorubrum sp. JWXQ-INN 858]MWV63858.1 hypothetical protein [Halorubrum sp. JWXQ-INN 858]
MTKRELQVTRREALAGVGAVGFATVGVARGRSTGHWNEYTNYTYAQTTGPQLLVGWRRTYNDAVVVDGPGGADDFVDGVSELEEDVPLVHAENVLPGDTGTASVGLRAEETNARVWMRLEVGHDGGPESLALADRIAVDVRYDTGLLGVGGCSGAEGDFAGYGEPIASGTLAAPATEPGANGDLATGVELDPGFVNNACLEPGENRCLVFRWAFPTGMGNVGKGGAVDFDVSFRAVECANPSNPFDDGVAT